MKKREMPNWPTYMQGLAVVLSIAFGTLALRYYTKIAISWALFISTVLGLFVGLGALHISEWLYNAHVNSVEGNARYNFGIFIATAIAATAGVVGVSLQLYKG